MSAMLRAPHYEKITNGSAWRSSATLHHGTQPSTAIFDRTNKCELQMQMKLLHFQI